MIVTVYIVNAFTRSTSGGNPAGVVLNAEQLNNAQMQYIATQVGLSETAFILPSRKAQRRIRFFTPVAEVDFCGHAIVASYALLCELKRLTTGEYTHELNSDVLAISISPNTQITMEQPSPKYYGEINTKLVAEALAIPPQWIINSNGVAEIVSTGLKDIIVPIDSIEHLSAINPNLKKICDLNRHTDSIGIHVFSLTQSNDIITAQCRNFAPAFGINEEAATGSSSGALACYLYKNRQKFKLNEAVNFLFAQGIEINSPSEITAALKVTEGEVVAVAVSGNAQLIGQKHFNI